MKDFFARLKKDRKGQIGLIIIVVVLLAGLLAPLIAPYGETETNAKDARMAPCAAHLLGTDESGMDIFSRCLYAIRIDVFIGVCGMLISLLIGIPLGLITGYYEGVVGEIIMRIADLLQAFPAFILAMALVAVMGNSLQNILIVIAIVNVPVYLRYVRTEVLSLKRKPFLEAAHTAGMKDFIIMAKEVLPNSLDIALVQASINIGGAILLTAGLSYIGAGVRVPTAEWGSMISIGAPLIITGEWWAAFFPGCFIAITVLGFALFGDFLRVYMNPERR